MQVVSSKEALSLPDGETVIVRGWVYRKREFKDKIFVLLRDGEGIIQLVFPHQIPESRIARELNIESSLIVEGVVKSDVRAPGGKEIHVSKVLWYFIGEPFPINEYAAQADSEYLLDVRHLWVRSRKMWAILRVRHTVFEAIHEYFRSKGFYEVHCPVFVSSAVEGGATLFKVRYFDREDVYLTQSAQFYLEALIFSLERVYTIAPSFRAEPSRTRRHLTEFWHAEAEMAWAGMRDVMRVSEELITHVVRKVLEDRLEELSLLKRNLEKLELVKPPFPRVSYDEAISMLNSMGLDIKWGADLGADEERALTQKFDTPIHLYGFPSVAKAFYHKDYPEDREKPLWERRTLSVDVLAPEGYGEIVGGGERIEDPEELRRKIREFGLKEEDYQWYIDLRKYGSVPHAGFGLGVDRLVMWICGLDHIRDSLPFPRDIRRVRP